jgi:chain length determinant protein tyrosine kinase EpsG
MFRTKNPEAKRPPDASYGAQATPGAASTDDLLRSPPTRISTDQANPAQPAGGAVTDLQSPIGQILVNAGRLNVKNTQRILQVATKHQLRFGEAGLRLGLLRHDDVDFALAQQFSFPYVGRADVSMSRDLLAAYAPDHPLVEQLRALRNQVLLRTRSVAAGHRQRAIPLVSVVSVARGDGRSFIAANLAAVFAMQGERTLLIDADMRNPRQDALFKLDNRAGLSTMLAGRSGIESVHRIKALGRLYVLTAGPTPPNPAELLGRASFAQILDSAETNFKAVVIDTPAGLGSADAAMISSNAGASILVARSNRTQVAQAKRFAKDLADSCSNVLGLVYNDRP